ncbi:putative Ig domain-containing protein [Shewanella sp. GD04112]|uniref:putative Ig domain-containing protein n=1 Tax=Shewanella sp. GD04112 TaxID=2975434 RepID=UPI0024490BB3|nr:putative Ig domain-containing protein [Shewanella sp. GD04112]MDH0446777.1 putative Ig domain-containing protein [Shewanella sp. GD04112]
MAFSGTLNFSGTDTTLGTPVTDGQAQSSDIPGVTIEIFSANSGNSNNGAAWKYYSDLFTDGTGSQDEGIADDSGNGSLIVVIRSQDGSEFSFTGIKIVDYLGAHSLIKFEAFQNGVSRGSVTLATDGDYISDFTQVNGLTASIFQYADEIRITDPISQLLYIGIDNVGFANAVSPDSTPPTVDSVNSSTANGTYKVGDVISVQVNFSENVNVTGTPQLTLETGSTDRTINYTSGTGTSTLNFNYTVQAGDTSADLDYVATTSLTLNGGTIMDAASNNATLTLASPGAAGSLGANKALVIDGVVPTVTSVNSSTANGTYKVGDNISIKVNFSEVVNVTGTPQLTLETGTIDRTINYASGSGSSTLTFSYTIQFGDNSSDLDYVATTSLSLNGGTIRDAATNNATLTLASPGAANSLGANKALVVDGVAPSVTSTAPSGGAVSTDTSVDFTVNFSESVSNISTDDFALGTTGSATGTIASVSAGSGSSVTVTVSGITGNGTIKLNLNGSTNISDPAGNAGPAAYTSGTPHTVAIPTAPDAPIIGVATAGDGQVSVAFTAPSNNGGSAITGYTVTSSPDGITVGGNGFTSSPITVTGLTNGTAYTFTVTATNAIGTSAASATSGSATPMADQTITFANPGAQNFGSSPTLSATSTAGLTVSFSSSTTGVCTITSGGVLTFVTAGSCTIDADQVGDGSTHAATTVSRTFTVNAVVPGAPMIGTATAGDTQASISFIAPASIGGAAITGYTATANPGGATGTGAGSPITVTGLTNGVSYTFTVTATNSAGTGSASAASNSITPASPQTITFANPGAQSFGTSPMLTATADSGLTVAFTSSTTSVCKVNSTTLTFVTAGSCTINADQPGNSAYLPAPQVSRTFTVNPALPGAPTSVAAIAGDTQASVSFTEPVNTGGTSITGYTVSVSPPDVLPVNGVGSPIVVNGLTNGQAYTFTVRADNAAGTGPASVVSNSITPKASQTITFNNPGAQNFGATPTFTATSDSGLTPTFTSSTMGVCAITSGGAVTFLTVGTCTINADQSGDASYLPGAQVSRSFIVSAVAPGAPTIGTATAGDAQASVSFTAPVFSGGAAITGYTLVSTPSGITAPGASSPITITGLTNGISYSFTVVATNSAGTSSASTASNTVKPNGAPVISGTPTLTVNQGVSYSYTLVATDSDVGDSLTLSAVTLPSWLSFNAATGVLSGTPTNANVGNHAVVLRATDVDGLTADQSFTIVVANVNDAPTISSTAVTSATQDAAYSYTLVATDSDVGDSLTLSPVTLPSWLSFNAATGVLSGTPSNANVGSHAVVLRATDVDGLTADQSFTIVVANVNDAPTISSTAVTSATQDVAYSYTLVATDSDVGDSLTLSAVTLPSWLSFNAATGVLSGTPTNANVGNHAIVLRATDVDGLTADQSFTIVVANVNDAPTISSTALTSATQDVAYSYTLVATDSDVGDSLTLSAVTLPSWLSFNAATGVLSGTPTNANVGSHAVVLRVTDVDGLTADQSFTIVVANVNDVPTISSTAVTNTTQDAAYSYTLVATDSDVGDSVTLSAVTLPSWLNFNAATGVLSGTPTNANVGSHAVVLRATDVDGLTIDQSFTIVVANVNDAPTISSTALTSATQDAAYSYTLVATDSDVGDSLTLSAVTLPNWLNFNAATGVLSGTPSNANVGNHAVVLRVTDVDGLTADQSFTIVVANVNDVPTISSTAVTNTTQDAAYSYTLVATDSDVGDSLTLSAVTLPSWLSFNAATGVLSGTPTNANVGSHAVLLRATDGDGLTIDQSFTIVVANVNDAPTISSTALTSATQDAAYSYTLVATDSDVGDSVTLSAVTLPSWLNFNAATGVLSGTPSNANVGSHAVVLRATDVDGLTADQSFTIVVANVNDAPTISSTAVTSATQDVAYSYTLVATDSDVGDSLTLSAVTLPSWLSFNAATGVLSGTPTNANVGNHAIVLRATDVDGLTADQSFTIVVANVNDAPTISSTALTSATQDVAYSYTLVATDSDVGDSLTLSAVTLPSWLSFNAATGVLSGTPTNANVGSHAVVLRVTDVDGLTADQSFTIVVANVNDVPTISSTAVTNTTQDAAYSYTLVATDSDVGDSVTLSAVTLPSWLNFNAATGVLSGTPTNANVGSHAVVLRATDVDGLTIDQSFTIVVANVNDAPTISSTALTSATQDAAYSYTLVATDSDVGDSLTLSAVTLPSWLSFNAATGVLSGTPTNANVGSHSVALRATDVDGLTADQSFTIVVANVNDAPTISSTALTSATQDTAYSYTLVATDSDVGDSLTLSAVTLPSWLSFNAATGVLSGTPTNANVGSHSVALRATDVDGLTADQSFTIVVANVNDAPTISSTALTSATQDTAYSYTLVATDSDVGDSLTLSAVTLPSWLSFNAATGVLSGTPTNANVGSHAVVLRATDGDGLTIDQSFTIVVANVNDAPTISSTALTSATQDAAYSYTLVATDSDVGDSLTLSAVTLPSWLSFNAATGVLSGTPTNANVGSHSVALRATDVDGLTADQSFTIVVANVNDAPTISSTALTSATQDAAYSYTLVATDSDVGDSLTLSAVTLPSWLNFNAATGVLSGTPTNANVGSHSVALRATDVDGLTADQSFTIVVANVNDAPTISSTALTSATQDAAYSYTLVATDSDVGDSLTLSAVILPSWLNFNAATGVMSGTPTNVNVGSHAVLLRATDVDGLTADQSFTIVVANINDAPTISSTALTSATQDAAYSYTLVATDSDVGDSLTLSAVTLPSWLSFNAATGVLSGTPTNANVGSHAVLLRATDVDGLTADQSFTIVVANINDAPIATNQTVTLEEDSSLMITLAAEDVDNDPLTYEITAQPTSGTLEQHGSVWLYTPEKDFNGTDSIGFIAKDAELSSEPATVTVTVTPVNDDPQAVDDSYILTSTPNDTYSLAVLANDVDVDGDNLTIDGAAADIGSVQITSDGLSFTAPEAYVGPVALRYTISDGNKGRATAKVNVLIEGADSANQPVITLPDDVEVNATGLFTRVKLGFAKAVDRNGHPLPVSLVNKSLFFAPGNYLAYWQAVDGEGNKAIKAQKVKVNPLISLSKDQVVAEGNQVAVSVHLNGEAPNYPLSIPYTVSGSADSSDHDLVDGVVEITSGQMAEIHFTTLNDGVTEGNEEVLISLDSSLNLGSKQQTQVVITEANIAPQVSLAVTQAGQQQVIVAQNGGDVHIRATASDANEQDTLTLTWASGTLSLQADATGMTFSPAAVSPGIYPVSLTVTDDGSPVLSSTETVYIVVRPSLAALTSADTDGDLIPDDQEGYSDSDRDGIPDYLDANNDCHVMPEGELQPVYFLAEGQAGVCLRLGNIALSRGQSGVQLQPEAVAEDALAANVGGIFDFIATGLPQQGQSYSLVLPQRSPVPANAVYRKFNAQAGWRDFVIDANNTVASTEGERGFCPPPGDSRWTPGLTEGHWCVQLTIEDGGPNDDDGVANRTIVDPSGVAVMLNGNHLPVANPDSAAIAWNQSIDVNVLANDTDSDGDSLSVTQVISEFGTVTVLADQRISYMPAADFIGTDVLVYSITDGKGGTASSELTIVVNGNTAPVTVDDSAATDDRTSLLIDVLSNDTDVDGNTLTLLSATAQQGTVTIEANKLRYIPKTGFDGVDTVTYRISDGQGGEATGQVLITVKAYQEVIIDNKSGGGSMTLWALAFILACAMLRRRELQRFALGSLLLLSVTQQAQATDWYVEGFIGQAQADKTLPELNVQVGEGQLLNVDDSDTAFGVSLGYQWTPTVALELGYADFGEGSARIKGSTLTPEQYHELVKTVTPVLADGVMLGLRFTLLQHQGWRFEVPVGLFHWQADISSTMGNTTIKTDLDGADWYAGVRFSYQFSDAWSVGLGYQYIDIEPNDLLSYQLNLRYQF